MIDLEAALMDLGDHLDVPDGDELMGRVVERLAAEPAPTRVVDLPAPWRRRNRALLVAAALLLALVVALSAVTPTREAIAHWLGIGAIEVRNEPTPRPTVPPGDHPVPGATTTGTQPTGGLLAPDVAAAQARVQFTIRLPQGPSAGVPSDIVTDDRNRGGLVAITYDRFTLVEMASASGSVPMMRKTLGPGARAENASVLGLEALWITGAPHEIGFLTPDNEYVTDSVRRAGDVLIWEDGGVTFRIEGLHDRAEAETVAASVR
jgi:hypothetical protein